MSARTLEFIVHILPALLPVAYVVMQGVGAYRSSNSALALVNTLADAQNVHDACKGDI